MAAGHLLELGHRRIGVVFGSPTSQATRLRLAAIRSGLPKWGWKPSARFIEADCVDVEDTVSAARRLLVRQHVTAIIASNDRVAARIMSDAQSQGVRVPDGLSVVGFDGTELGEHTSPPLDSVLIPWAQMARAAADLILLQVNDSMIRDAQLVWRPRLIRRGSCARPSAKG